MASCLIGDGDAVGAAVLVDFDRHRSPRVQERVGHDLRSEKRRIDAEVILGLGEGFADEAPCHRAAGDVGGQLNLLRNHPYPVHGLSFPRSSPHCRHRRWP